MTVEYTTTAGGSGGANRRLDALSAHLERSVRSARRRNVITLVLAIISLALIGYYLFVAHREFTKWDAEVVADYGQARLIDALPGAAQDLKKSLREQAPNVIDAGEQELRQMPDRLVETLQREVEQRLAERAPEAEERLYQTLLASIDEADKQVSAAAGEKRDDEERFKAMLDVLVHAYGTETSKLLENVHERYKTGATDIIGYLDLLAEGEQLTPQQESQRTMIRTFLILARERHEDSAGTSGTGTSTAQPAGAAIPSAEPQTQQTQDAAAPAAEEAVRNTVEAVSPKPEQPEPPAQQSEPAPAPAE